MCRSSRASDGDQMLVFPKAETDSTSWTEVTEVCVCARDTQTLGDEKSCVCVCVCVWNKCRLLFSFHYVLHKRQTQALQRNRRRQQSQNTGGIHEGYVLFCCCLRRCCLRRCRCRCRCHCVCAISQRSHFRCAANVDVADRRRRCWRPMTFCRARDTERKQLSCRKDLSNKNKIKKKETKPNPTTKSTPNPTKSKLRSLQTAASASVSSQFSLGHVS